MNADNVRRYLEFYQDLGIQTLYKRMAAPVDSAPEALQPAAPQPEAAAPPPDTLPPMAARDKSLIEIIQDIGDCRRCRLHEERTKIVFGVGDEHSPLVFVGEGPGADEDAQGIPFVGRAGQLLTQMIENTAKKEGIDILRKDVYICNVVKCRPPEIRTPEPGEMATCGGFLYRQLTVLGR